MSVSVHSKPFDFKEYAEFIHTEAMNYGNNVTQSKALYLKDNQHHTDSLKSHILKNPEIHRTLDSEITTTIEQRNFARSKDMPYPKKYSHNLPMSYHAPDIQTGESWRTIPKMQGGFVSTAVLTDPHIKGGLLGVAGAGAAAAVEAHKGVGAALNAAAEAILPGSSTAGNNVCKVAGTVIGGVAGTVAAAGAGTATFTATAVPTTPVGATVLSVAAGGAAYSVTQPVAKQATEALCNTVLPDSVKAAAGKAIAAINSALSFGGSDKAPQTIVAQKSSDTGKAR
jgi:hypothetical protein